jgi:hypothetical protein
MKKTFVLVTAVISVIVLMLSIGVNFAQAQEKMTDKDLMIKQCNMMVEKGQMMKEKATMLKEGSMDKETMMKEGDRMMQEGDTMM